MEQPQLKAKIRSRIVQFDRKFLRGVLKRSLNFLKNLSPPSLNVTSRKISVVHPVDLFLSQIYNGDSFQHYDIIVKHLALPEIASEGGGDFYLSMQKQRGLQEEICIEKFRKLFGGISTDGFDSKSFIYVDENLTVTNGTHRLAISLFLGLEEIPIYVLNKVHSPNFGFNWFEERQFEQSELVKLKLHKDVITDFCEYEVNAILWPSSKGLHADILAEIGSLNYVSSPPEIISITSPAECLDYFVRAAYFLDDVSENKIDKKIAAIKNQNENCADYTIYVLKFQFKIYEYKLKNKFFKMQCVQSVLLKKHIREKFKHFIDNYVHDTIIHVPDNFLQNSFCNSLILANKLDLRAFFDSVKDWQYALTKISGAKQPHNFPDSFFVKSDADILVHPSTYHRFTKKCVDFLNSYEGVDGFAIKLISTKSDTKIRLELHSYLIFQFHVLKGCTELTQDFFLEAVSSGVFSDNQVKVLSPRNEFVLRLREVLLFPHKSWHFDFLTANIEEATGLKFEKIFESSMILGAKKLAEGIINES